MTTKNSFMVKLAGFAEILLQWILKLCNYSINTSMYILWFWWKTINKVFRFV